MKKKWTATQQINKQSKKSCQSHNFFFFKKKKKTNPTSHEFKRATKKKHCRLGCCSLHHFSCKQHILMFSLAYDHFMFTPILFSFDEFFSLIFSTELNRLEGKGEIFLKHLSSSVHNEKITTYHTIRFSTLIFL